MAADLKSSDQYDFISTIVKLKLVLVECISMDLVPHSCIIEFEAESIKYKNG